MTLRSTESWWANNDFFASGSFFIFGEDTSGLMQLAVVTELAVLSGGWTFVHGSRLDMKGLERVAGSKPDSTGHNTTGSLPSSRAS